MLWNQLNKASNKYMTAKTYFEDYRQLKENEKKLVLADQFFKGIQEDDPRWKEAERRLNLLIKETAALYLRIYD